jgi:hypothetical protein
MEKIALTTPITGPSTSEYFIESFTMQLGMTMAGDGSVVITPINSKISVTLYGSNRMTATFEWSGQVAHDDIIALNKANLSTTSLQKRIMQRLMALGYIAGTVTGTVD